MPLVVDPKTYVIGPALVYRRAVGVLTPWTSMGPVMNCVGRVVTEWFRPELPGVFGPVMGLDILRRVMAEISFDMPEWAGEKFSYAVPGSIVTAPTGAEAGGSHLDTTLSGATAVGASTIPLTAVTNGAVGDPIKIGTGATAEYRVITAIASLDVSFRDPLLFGHAAAEEVVEAVDDNRTLITAPLVRRQPDTAYAEWAVVAESGKSGVHELRIVRGIAQSDTAQMSIADDALAAIPVTIGARYYGPDLSQSPFRVYAPAA